MMKYYVKFNLTFFGTAKAKNDCVIETREIFKNLPQINISVTVGSSFLLLSKSTIIILNTINILHFFIWIVIINWISFKLYKYFVKALKSFNCFRLVCSCYLISLGLVQHLFLHTLKHQ